MKLWAQNAPHFDSTAKKPHRSLSGPRHRLIGFTSFVLFDAGHSRKLIVEINKNLKFIEEWTLLIWNFLRVLNVVRFLLGNSPASEFYMPTFRNTLFHFHRQVGAEWLGLRNVGVLIRGNACLENSLSQYDGGWQGRGWVRVQSR